MNEQQRRFTDRLRLALYSLQKAKLDMAQVVSTVDDKDTSEGLHSFVTELEDMWVDLCEYLPDEDEDE